MDRIKVLIVDDHAIMREGIRALIGICDDFTVVGEASDGNEAIARTKELLPDVVIMDIAMFGLDGLEATRRIKRENSRVKILILTQYSNAEYVLSAVKAGAAGYVPKEALSSELISAIRTVYKGDSFLHPRAATALMENYRLRAGESPLASLTEREREILKLLAEGQTFREISGRLSISPWTVLKHRANMMEKLNLRNRTELLKYALRKGLTSVDS